MTLSTSTSRANYTGNGSAGTFAYTFKIFSEDDLLVTVRDADNNETTLVIDTDYTVTGVGATAGGNVVLVDNSQAWVDGSGNLDTGYYISVRRVRQIIQETDIKNQGAFYPEVHEDQFDILTMVDQQQQDEIDRSVKLSETVSNIDPILPAPSAGKAIGWNATADGLENIASPGSVAISAFMETVLDDTSAAAARVTLDTAQKISSMTEETAPATGDFAAIYDVSATAERKMTLENALKVVNSLTEDTSPASSDYILSYDSSAGAAKKVAFSNIASSGASGLESLQNKLEAEGFGVTTRELDNSVANSAKDIPYHTFFTGYLIENYTSGGSSVKAVWNPIVIYDSDKNYDSITNWAAVGAGATLAATAGTAKVGSNHFSFDKNGTAVDASIRHTLAAQTLNVGGNYRVYFWINFPSITGLSSVFLKIMGAATTDFSRWNLTTDYSGAALATGWNLMFVDIKNTAASTTGGTAWTTTQLARYVEVGVTTSSAGQTYTAIKFDGLWFSHGAIDEVNFNQLEMTGFDTSNKNNFQLATSNTRYDGPLTLSATVAQSYTAGISNADACKLQRSTLSWSTGGSIGFDSNLSSGAISLAQEARLVKQFRESISGNISAFVDMYTPQVYKVTAVGGSTIDVEDPANTSANLLNGDSIHIFERIINAGEITFAHRATRSMTAGASHSSGTTTLTVTTTSIAVGDYIVKQQLDVKASLVGKTVDESFSSMSYDTTPNGVQLINQGRAVPNPNYLYAAWDLAGPNQTLALRDKTGNGRDLSKAGSPNLTNSFQRGRYSLSVSSASDYLRTGAATKYNYDGNGEQIQISLWFYYDTTYAGYRTLCATYSNSGSAGGWYLQVYTGTNTLDFTHASGGAGLALDTNPSLSAGTWNHIVIQTKSSTTQNLYLNGVKFSRSSPGAISEVDSGQALYFGCYSGSGSIDTNTSSSAIGLKIADALVWRDGPLLTQAQVNALYNAGAPVPTGFFPVVRNEYKLSGQSGQKLSLKATMSRSTTAVSPQILDLGAIKT